LERTEDKTGSDNGIRYFLPCLTVKPHDDWAATYRTKLRELAIERRAHVSGCNMSSRDAVSSGNFGRSCTRVKLRFAHGTRASRRNIVGDRMAADDVAIEVYTPAWRQAGNFESAKGTTVAWLLKISRSRALDALRAGRRSPLASPIDDAVEEVRSADPGPANLSMDTCMIFGWAGMGLRAAGGSCG